MEHTQAYEIPLVCELNRVERLYTGGAALDRWQGIEPAVDGIQSEEFLVSTIEYMGPGNPPHQGLSLVRLPGGGSEKLKDLIAANPEAFLGRRYAGACQGHSGVLARVGDATVRLVLQSHPTADKANRLLHSPFGKTEAWYIAETRDGNGEKPYVYCGFKPGITKEKWQRLFQVQDVPAMLACLHRLPVQKGDCVLIPAGMPHAMGPGSVFIEIHEPCDYTFRLEKNYAVRPLADEEMHFGLGVDTLMDMFEYDGYTEEEIRAKCVMQPVEKDRQPGGRRCGLLAYNNTERFALDKVQLNGTYALPDFNGHYLLITADGPATLSTAGGYTVEVPQGRGVFVPAGVRGLTVTGHGAVLVAYPFRLAGGEVDV